MIENIKFLADSVDEAMQTSAALKTICAALILFLIIVWGVRVGNKKDDEVEQYKRRRREELSKQGRGFPLD